MLRSCVPDRWVLTLDRIKVVDNHPNPSFAHLTRPMGLPGLYLYDTEGRKSTVARHTGHDIWGGREDCLSLNNTTVQTVDSENDRKCGVEGIRWEHRLNMELLYIPKIYLGSMCTAVLLGWDPATPPFPPTPAFGLIFTRAQLVSQGKRHLFVIPWLRDRGNMRFHRKLHLPTHNDRPAKTMEMSSL